MKRKRLFALLAVLLLAAAGYVLAQFDEIRTDVTKEYRTAREADLGGVSPTWPVDPHFKKDVFTFVRIKYIVDGKYGLGHTPHRWMIDFPKSDLNFSFRLQQMTSMKVDPDGLILQITDKELTDYPFIYIVEPGRLTFTEEEVPVLRRYLLNGGFLMVDDFWGEREWGNFKQEMKRVFPEREAVDLPIEHPIFHCVFDLKAKPQIPNVILGIESQLTGITWEREDAKEPHYRGIFDDKGRMMVMICHNTDLGDGFEMEGKNEYFFHQFSEKQAYPLGINIIFYAMTH